MKKNVVKAMSVGLSAITIASSLSVPVFAEESTEGGQPADTGAVVEPVVTPSPEAVVANDTAALNASYNGVQPSAEPATPAAPSVDVQPSAEPATPAAPAADAQPIIEGDVQSTSETQPVEPTKTTLEEVQDVVDAAGDEDITSDTYDSKYIEDGSATYKEGAEAVQDDAQAAGTEIAKADSDAADLNKAAENMDTANSKAGTALVEATAAATSANGDITQANNDVKAAAQAVATGTKDEAESLIAKAESSVAKAEKNFETAKSDYETKLENYNQAVEDYNDARQEYITKKQNLSNDLGAAKEKLADATAKLSELKTALEDAEKDFANAGANAILTAEEKKATNTAAYVEAIMKYYYIPTAYADVLTKDANDKIDFDAAKITVTEADDKDDKYVVSYVDSTGKTIEREYTYSIKQDGTDGTFEINEILYTYTVKNNDGTTTDYAFTKQEMEAKVSARTAVKRYAITTIVEGVEKVEYKAADELTAEQLKNTPFEYVVLVNDADDADEYAEEGEITHFFDEKGNYIKAVTGIDLNGITIYINGKPVVTEEYFADSDRAEEIKKAIIGLVGSAEFEVLLTKNTTYTAVGNFVARYTDVKSWNKSNNDAWRGSYKRTKFVADPKPDGHTAINDEKENAKEEWLDDYDNKNKYHNVEFVGYNDDWKAEENWSIKPVYIEPFGTVNFQVTGTGKVSYDIVTNTKVDFSTWEGLADIFRNIANLFGADLETAKEKAEAAAKKNIEEQNGIFVKLVWNDLIPNKATVYYVAATDVADQTKHYDKLKDAQDAVNKQITDMGATGMDRNNVTYEDWYQASLSYNKTITTFNASMNDGTTQISDAQGSGYTAFMDKVKAYAALLKEIDEAQKALNDAQGKVDAIQAKLEELDKASEKEELVAEWEQLLTIAENNKNNAQKNLDDAKKALNDTKNAYDAKYPAIYIPAGEPVKYPSVTTATTVEEADEEVIPDDAVPAAGQTRAARTTRTRRTAANNAAANDNTTTIDEAETPLAGGDADDAVVEDKEDTTTVEEDLVPLAGEAQKGFFARTWWGWLLLIIAVLTGTTAYAKKKADAKKIK